MKTGRLLRPSVLVAVAVSVVIFIMLYQLIGLVSWKQQFSFENGIKHQIIAEYASVTRKLKSDTLPIDVMFLFNNARSNQPLQEKLKACLQSMFSRMSRPPVFHFAGDVDSFVIVKEILKTLSADGITKVVHHDVNKLPENSLQTIHAIHQQISGQGHNFSHPLFYMSVLAHQVMPSDMSRLIILDVDLIFKSDIVNLFRLFENFKDGQVIGIARDNQPVYRHVFWQYRKEFPSTRVGDPPPKGLTGFNSGVVLFDLDAMRKSAAYNAFLSENVLASLVRKYKFQGHLGDQDFFTLVSFENESLFYILPCGWNRQLCTWWRRDDFVDIFDQYFQCREPIHIWHGNCRTSLQNYTLRH